jgi:hypothetical protein
VQAEMFSEDYELNTRPAFETSITQYQDAHPPMLRCTKKNTPRYHKTANSHRDYRPIFFAHFDFFGGSAITKDVTLGFPFSTSEFASFGEPGISSNLVLTLLLDRLFECISFGNVDLRGVKAVTTLRAELRILARISHDRFFARYHNTADTTGVLSARLPQRIEGHSPPKIQTDTAQTIIAIIAPLDNSMDPEELPAAPASESPALDPADDPTSPGAGPGHLLAL